MLGIDHPIVQAPMAGVSSPAMAAAVPDAGGLGSIGVGGGGVETAAKMIAEVRARSTGPLNVNVFAHRPAEAAAAREAAWIERMRPHFDQHAATPPTTPRTWRAN
jgi:nitronate monooxygenase